MKAILVPGVLALACTMVAAKLPPLDDAAKAKAAEAAAKAAWQGKVDAYKTCKVQDKIAAAYMKTAGKPMPAKDAKAAAPAVAAASKPASGASATTGATTPVASAAPPPCADPGPFAYNAPEQKPLETSGAHSPAGNANSPPSVKQNSAEMKPAKKS
jgi:hypothetical protein